MLSDAKYFEENGTKNGEIHNLLESKEIKDKLEAMKRLLALMTMGRDVSIFFPAVVKNVIAEHAELKKLVYMYITHYADTNQDVALMTINTFQRDLKSHSQRVKANAMRAMASINVPVVVPLIVLALQSCIKDISPYVRRAAATAIPKIFTTDENQLDVCVECIEELLTNFDAGVLGATLYAFDEVCPDRYDLLHPHYQKLCHLLADLDSWGQVVAIKVLTRYCRRFFAAPPGWFPLTGSPADTAAAAAAAAAAGAAVGADGTYISESGSLPPGASGGAFDPASMAATAAAAAAAAAGGAVGGGAGGTYLSKYAVRGGGSFYDDEATSGNNGDDDDEDDVLALSQSNNKKDKKDKKKDKNDKKSKKSKKSGKGGFYDDSDDDAAASDSNSASDSDNESAKGKGKGKKAAPAVAKTASLLPMDLLDGMADLSITTNTNSAGSASVAPVNLIDMMAGGNSGADTDALFNLPSPTVPTTAATAAAAAPAAAAESNSDSVKAEASGSSGKEAKDSSWPEIGGSPASDMVPVSLSLSTSAPAVSSPPAPVPAAAAAAAAAAVPKKPAVIDSDLAWFLTSTAKLLRSTHVSVIVAVAAAHTALAPRAFMPDIVRALIRATRSSRHMAYVVYSCIATLVPRFPLLFRPFVREFYLSATDARPVAVLKLDCLAQLARFDQPASLMNELVAYARFPDKALVCHVARTIARVGTAITPLAGLALRALMALVTSSSAAVVADAVIAIRHLVQRYRDDVPVGVIKALARLLPTLTNPMGRCAIVWIVGEHRQRIPTIAPDVLRVLTKAFITEHAIVKMQTLNLAVKLYLSTPAVAAPYFKYIMDLAKVDESCDLRERARMYRVLFFKKKAAAAAAAALDDTQEAKDVLKQCILAPRPVPELDSPFAVRAGYPLDSLSHLLAIPAPGFVALPAFPEVGSDPALRKPYEPSKAPVNPRSQRSPPRPPRPHRPPPQVAPRRLAGPEGSTTTPRMTTKTAAAAVAAAVRARVRARVARVTAATQTQTQTPRPSAARARRPRLRRRRLRPRLPQPPLLLPLLPPLRPPRLRLRAAHGT